MGKAQQRVVSYENQGAQDFKKYGFLRFRWSRTCDASRAYNRGFFKAKYGHSYAPSAFGNLKAKGRSGFAEQFDLMKSVQRILGGKN